MSRPCLICSRQDRASIDARLLAGLESGRQIAARVGVPESSLRRHRQVCLQSGLVVNHEAMTLWREISCYRTRLLKIAEDELASENPNRMVAVAAYKAAADLAKDRLRRLGSLEPHEKAEESIDTDGEDLTPDERALLGE